MKLRTLIPPASVSFGTRGAWSALSGRLCQLLVVVALLATAFSGSAYGAGVAIITHGFIPLASDASVKENPSWLEPMQFAIANSSNSDNDFQFLEITLAGFGKGIGDIDVTFSPSTLSLDKGEIIVILNWRDISNHLVSVLNTRVIALTVVSELISYLDGRLVEVPIHLIGHSRGGSLVS